MFRVENLFNDRKPVYDDDGYLKVWDNVKNGRIVDRYTEDDVDYVVVKFNAPGNPPSNDFEYIYIAP